MCEIASKKWKLKKTEKIRKKKFGKKRSLGESLRKNRQFLFILPVIYEMHRSCIRGEREFFFSYFFLVFFLTFSFLFFPLSLTLTVAVYIFLGWCFAFRDAFFLKLLFQEWRIFGAEREGGKKNKFGTDQMDCLSVG